MCKTIPVQRQQLVSSNVELVARLERLGLDAFLGLDREVDLVERTANLVDLANGCLQQCQPLRSSDCDNYITHLVLEVDRRVEVRDLGVDGLAEHLALDIVNKSTHFCILGQLKASKYLTG